MHSHSYKTINNMKFYAYYIGKTEVECILDENVVTIRNSYRITDDEKKIYILKRLLEDFPYIKKHNRNLNNMLNEWKAHNILYQHNYKVKSTKDTDLELKQKLFYKIAYFLISHLMKEKHE